MIMKERRYQNININLSQDNLGHFALISNRALSWLFSWRMYDDEKRCNSVIRKNCDLYGA